MTDRQCPSPSYYGFGAHPTPEAMRFDMVNTPVTSVMSVTSSSLQPAERIRSTSASVAAADVRVNLVA